MPRTICRACDVSVKMNVFARARLKTSSSSTAMRLVSPVNFPSGSATVAFVIVNQMAMPNG